GGVPLWSGLGVPTDPEDIWELGKLQRGGIDPDTGAIGAPAFRAAAEHYKIRANGLSPHGNSYGGFMPVPVDAGGCADPINKNWQIFFTNLDDSSVLAYPGTCPEEPTHVAAVVPTPTNYLVFLNDGSVDILKKNEWIEGPYTGGSFVRKTFGDHLPRVLNAFAADFRGTEDERAAQTTWLQYAFDTERFLANQYHLAPAIGTEDGPDIDLEYPLFKKEVTPGTTLASGTSLIHQQSSTTSHAYTAGFVLASAFLKSHRLDGPVEIEFLDGATVIKTVTLTPDGSGNGAQIVTFETAITPTLAVRLASGATFFSGEGWISVETSELLEYKPEAHDLYLTLRLASCRTSLVNGLDGSGEDETEANLISDDYFANGCILNRHGAPGPAGTAAEVNSNAVFEAARRMSQWVRILPRQQFTGMELSGGKTTCYFNRYATVSGIEVDMFAGIAPAAEEVLTGEIMPERKYVVRSGGSVLYNAVSYAVDEVFTGAAGVQDFTSETETAGHVFEYDGIRANAEPEGLSNEWLMGTQLKVYGHEEASLWKPESYSDYYFWSNRCHFYHPAYPSDLRDHFDFGQNESLAPEAFSGWNYVHNTNRWECDEVDTDCQDKRRDRYKSCRIYEPMPEIESATLEDDGATVRLTFKGRFHHHDGAPASYSRDVGTWDATALKAESYRTMENALREYLVYLDDGTHCVGGGQDLGTHNLGQQGNSAFMTASGSDPWGFPDNPHGACFPHFYFLGLFPKPYEDANDAQNATDTPLGADIWRMADFYSRAMCEGFV
ncbi:MAG TPA: hypothetical protein VK633_09795, partial [Verrucomicrobiae bacterium]|nr:hypothetical protein [Verrucomicrobiae bacterium]